MNSSKKASAWWMPSCACQSAAIDAALAAKNVGPRIHGKGPRGHPLTDEQKARSRGKSKTRSRAWSMSLRT